MSRLTALRLVVASSIVLIAGAAMVASQRSATAMANAANAWLTSLSPEQRTQATFAFDSEERLRWHFIPTWTFARKGLTIKEMAPKQRELAQAMLKSGLSQKGLVTANSIMELETILRAVEKNDRRDPEGYFFSVFGTPSAAGAWGWRVEGHHISLRFTVVKGMAVASAPAFLGTNPAEVRDGEKKGLRVLGASEDTARALLESLNPTQRTAAIINVTAPSDILTTNKNDITPLEATGVSSASLTPKQRELLMQVIDTYTSIMEADIASERRAALDKAGLDKILFAWAGETERGKKHYYRIQGPTFLVEYDNTQNDGNHVHSVWRDFNGDFGRDLLREHLKTVAH
ncbi:MAG: DUF3500 domain-containing protein [Vicinamibacterales bacterium]